MTAYGPSTSTTWNLSAASVVFVRWGSTPGQPYVGVGPLSWAHTTARLQSETERSLADEGARTARAIARHTARRRRRFRLRRAQDAQVPISPGHAEKPYSSRLRPRAGAKGRTAAPQRDWQAARLGPAPPVTMATIRKDAFEAVLAACGTPPSLFVDSDGTSQREAVRRWHLNTVLPLARLVEHELFHEARNAGRIEVRLLRFGHGFARNGGCQAGASGRKRAQAGVPMTTALEAVNLDGG